MSFLRNICFSFLIPSTILFSVLSLTAMGQDSGARRDAGDVAPLTAEAIMARVAVNQDSEEALRTHYVYVQHARVVSRKGKTVICEEVTDIRVTPSSKGSHQRLIELDGRVLDKKKYVEYHTMLPDKANPEGPTDGTTVSVEVGDHLDRGLVEDFRNELISNSGTNSGDGTGDHAGEAKDGIGEGLFPLTSRSQAHYAFRLLGRAAMNGRDTFHIEFRPKDKDDFTWKGEAYIDAAAYQPVVVSTTMNRKLPFAVRTLMGINLPGLGFTVVYAPQPDGVWFPTSFSTEFKIKVLFFFNREITIDAKNGEFVKTHGEGETVDTVDGGEAEKPR